MPNSQFTFNISLSVLNHLGRNLYRNFATILWEAVSNAWDANAENIWITIDDTNNNFVIKDDGDGMTRDDFKDKFLNIGYSKRNELGNTSPDKNRPYIGRKWIGKLALLSCAEKIHIISKTISTEYIWWMIDNRGLDEAITDNAIAREYELGPINEDLFSSYKTNHSKGTIIFFEEMKDGMRNSIDYLRKTLALYFRFSLVDPSFHIFLNGAEITYEDLSVLGEKTEFLWKINSYEDNFVSHSLTSIKEGRIININDWEATGFIGSVTLPSNKNIFGASERIGIDLFVNGRLREKDILKHMPSARLAEAYLYGQIHFNELDGDDEDRFTSNREGILSDDLKYKDFLSKFKTEVISVVIDEWDKLRVKYREDGDSENPRLSKKERKSRELYNEVSKEYTPSRTSPNKTKIDGWIESLENDAQFNLSSYAECFISENLIRKYIQDQWIAVNQADIDEANKWRRTETQSKSTWNVNINIRAYTDHIHYLDMSKLSYIAETPQTRWSSNTITLDAKAYKPIRDAMAHTGLLTQEAKAKLTSVYDNIKWRLKTLLSGS